MARMSEQREFFASYEGEMNSEDREALTRPGWKLYENGIGSTAGFRGDEMPPVKWRQVVRLRASSDNDAMRLIIQALGYEPEGLRADESKSSEG